MCFSISSFPFYFEISCLPTCLSKAHEAIAHKNLPKVSPTKVFECHDEKDTISQGLLSKSSAG
ncbi:hypothetical protein EWS92_21425 [Vibrio vulnificus]|nr:hypothetical protein [Vibrio vulnificus]EGR0799554.1 hypothetical protein [Vibrio vulnificus]EGR0817034.1 hypothetical protein [Vibrio vulnificus]EGR0828800.1 hypothetical protein [Vibrio vulnificus]EGR0849301.1 hypothetical protein [Vibrio vulnificus]